MTQNEFVNVHGEQAWELMVKPMQENGSDYQKGNANAICHERIQTVLALLGFPAVSGLLEVDGQIIHLP